MAQERRMTRGWKLSNYVLIITGRVFSQKFEHKWFFLENSKFFSILKLEKFSHKDMC